MRERIVWRTIEGGVEGEGREDKHSACSRFRATVIKGEGGCVLTITAESIYDINDYTLTFAGIEQAKHFAEIAFNIYQDGVAYGSDLC